VENRVAEAKRIGVDGYNLALERGTGVATYGHNLQHAARLLGHEVDGIYGVPSAQSNVAVLREIALVDTSATRSSRLRTSIRRLRAAFGTAKAEPIRMTGQVIMDPNTARRFPRFDTIWNAPDLFVASRLHFGYFGRRQPVEIDGKIDIMHWTYPLPLELKGAANVYTLHDLVPLRLPYTTLDNKRYYYRLTKMLTDTADHILTVSETSRRDIIDLFGVDEKRVTNTYQVAAIPAALTRKTADEVAQEVSGIFGLDYQNYYMFFGAIEPKKNVGRLIQAYLTASGEVNAPLVLVGSKAWKADQELRLLRSATLEQRRRVRIIEYAPFALLISLIRGSRAVIFPSIYEGFGLPVLEAMQLGVPVITSGVGSLKEVAGDAARFVDPYDVDSIYKAMRDVDGSPSLRAELAAAGLKRAEFFSMASYQERLRDLYARL
jgi:glycosyltransferase involved in cell wall biosynthesis